ncbi:MAG: hypothetical protein AAFZ15_16195 [Bacteroidota bacterium]
MKKITLLLFLVIPFFVHAQQELDEKIIGGHNFMEISITERSLTVYYKCETEGLFILNKEDKKHKFESFASILDYFEQRGWDFFMHHPSYNPEFGKVKWIMRRR